MAQLKKILLVDDDRISMLAMQRALKNLSVQTPTQLAQNGHPGRSKRLARLG